MKKRDFFYLGVIAGLLFLYFTKPDNCPAVVIKQTKTEIDTLYVTDSAGIPEPKIVSRETIKYVTDTSSMKALKESYEKQVVYFSDLVTQYRILLDSVEQNILPSTIIENLEELTYSDSIKGDFYRVDYTIRTLGYLRGFEPIFTIYPKTEVQYVEKKLRPSWGTSIGLIPDKDGMDFYGGGFYQKDRHRANIMYNPFDKSLFVGWQFSIRQ